MGIILGIIGIFFLIGLIGMILEAIWNVAKVVIPIIIAILLILFAVKHIKLAIIALIIFGILYLMGNSSEKEKRKNMNIAEKCINTLGMADSYTIKRETNLSEEKLKEALQQLHVENKIEKEIMNKGSKNGQVIYKSINIRNGTGNFTNYERQEINLD